MSVRAWKHYTPQSVFQRARDTLESITVANECARIRALQAVHAGDDHGYDVALRKLIRLGQHCSRVVAIVNRETAHLSFGRISREERLQ